MLDGGYCNIMNRIEKNKYETYFIGIMENF